MEVFINECSLNSQFADNYAFINSLKTFISSLKFISNIKREKVAFKSKYFFSYTGIAGSHLESLLKSNPELNRTFFENFQFLNPKDWENTQCHDASIEYVYSSKNYSGTSVAEIAERNTSLPEYVSFLLNFEHSQFDTNIKIDVIKNNSTTIPVDCVYNSDTIINWLISKGILNPNAQYDENSKIAPLDSQTVLGDTSKFELTQYKNNGRKVYRLIGSSQLWVVDGAKKHAGSKAHIEVFDEVTKKHLGTSLYNVIKLDTTHKAPNRTITLN